MSMNCALIERQFASTSVYLSSFIEKCKESDFETRLFDPLNKRCYEKRLGNH